MLCDAQLWRGGAWGEGGAIVFSANPTSPLFRVNAAGGTPAPLTTIDSAQHTSHRWPYFLPDGRHFLYLAISHDTSKSASDVIYYASVDGRENRPLLNAQSNAIYADGFLLFARGDQLLAQPFDPANGALSGAPRAVAKGVMNDSTTWHMDATASGDGVLVFASGGSGDLQLVWLDRTGKQVGAITDTFPNLLFAGLSPQGDRVALQMDSGVTDIWVLDLARGVRTRLTFGPVSNVSPVWSPDGKWIAYAALRGNRYSIFRKPSDGSGPEEFLMAADLQVVATDWSRDGKSIFYWSGSNDELGAWVLPLEGDRKPRKVLDRGAAPVLSPDGHWLAYMSTESGGMEVYVVGYDGAQGKWQVSVKGGQGPQWSADGKQLYYLDPSFNVLSVPVKSVGGALQFGSAQTLITTWSAPNVFYSVTRDGKRFLMDQAPQHVSQSVTVVSNFTAALNTK